MAADDEIQIVVFRVGTQEFALDIFQIERILRYEKPSRVPRAPDYLEGVISWGGRVVPVVDLRKRLEVRADLSEDVRIMVLILDEDRIGMLVDQVVEVLRVDSTSIAAPPPLVRGLAAEFISGIVNRPDRTIVMLNAGRLLNSQERAALTWFDAPNLTPGGGEARS